MKTVFAYGEVNPYKSGSSEPLIKVEQTESGKRLFRVTYGLDVGNDLTYDQACRAIGSTILHHLCCEGIASNEGV